MLLYTFTYVLNVLLAIDGITNPEEIDSDLEVDSDKQKNSDQEIESENESNLAEGEQNCKCTRV